jgi:thiol-disulfide isomerase/thioredoxin
MRWRFTGRFRACLPKKSNVKLLAVVLLAMATGTGLATVRYGAPPPDFQVPTQRGSEALSQLKGKPVVINFWASWCPPCTDELPYFERLQADYGDRIRVITVNWAEDPGTALAYLRAKHLDLPVVSDPQSKIYAAYSLSEVPDTLVLDASGNVVYVSVGGLSWEELRTAVERALQ